LALTYQKLNKPERAVWDAMEAGIPVKLPLGAEAPSDPSHGESWDNAHAVRGPILHELVTGRAGTKAIHPRGLELVGARITESLDLEASTLVCPLTLVQCWFDEDVILNGAQASAIRFTGCQLPSLVAAQLQVSGNLLLNNGFRARGGVLLSGAQIGGRLSLDRARLDGSAGYAMIADQLTVQHGMSGTDGFSAEGGIRLPGAHIGGDLSFTGARLSCSTRPALDADGIAVDGNLFCRSGFSAQGEISLIGAQIGGQLSFTGATLANPGGRALFADELTVDHGMFCTDGYRAEGEVLLRGAHLHGQLSFTNGTLANRDRVALNAEGITVDQSMLCDGTFRAEGEVRLLGAQIGGQLNFTGATLVHHAGKALSLRALRVTRLLLSPGAPPEGAVDLRGAQVDVLSDQEATWPERTHLQGFVYTWLVERPPITVSQRLRWLASDPNGYAPQPYEQLIAVYRRSGREEDARTMAIEKQRRRRTTLKLPGRLWNSLLFWTVGYGYRNCWAGLWLMLFLLIGGFVFAAAHPDHIVPAGGSTDQPVQFQPFVYALDTLLPIVDLQQQSKWVLTGLAQWWAWISILAGWVLTTAIVAALTGLIKKE
jgi:hypothetical protein